MLFCPQGWYISGWSTEELLKKKQASLISGRDILGIISGDKLDFVTETPPIRDSVRKIINEFLHQCALNAEIQSLLSKNVIVLTEHSSVSSFKLWRQYQNDFKFEVLEWVYRVYPF